MNNQEALAYIDRLWNNYGVLYSDKKNAGHEEEAELMQKYFMSLGAAKKAIKALELSSELEKNSQKLEKDFGELDCISRADLYNRIKKIDHDEDYECDEFGGSKITYHTCDWDEVLREIEDAPSVTPQEPQSFKWCTDCKEYDQENHCCHRWAKVIRNTVEEMKQGYIEREVLDKIRAEIERQEKWLMDAGYNQYNVDIALDAIKSVVDKYKAESEG